MKFINNSVIIIVEIVMVLFAALIGKAIFENKKKETNSDSEQVENTATSIFKYIIYIIVGLIAIWLFATIWLAIVGHPNDDVEFQRYK